MLEHRAYLVAGGAPAAKVTGARSLVRLEELPDEIDRGELLLRRRLWHVRAEEVCERLGRPRGELRELRVGEGAAELRRPHRRAQDELVEDAAEAP